LQVSASKAKYFTQRLTTSALDEQTKQARQTMDSISGRFKPVIDDGAEALIDLTESEYPEGQAPQDAMHHPYHLCGVATHLGVTYLLHPDTKSSVAGAQQWWRIQYDTETSSPSIRRDRLTQQEVLERAATESSAALLVYAHKDALSVTPEPLSKPLEDFVKKDGWNFQEELQKDASAWDDVDYNPMSDIQQGDWDRAPPDYEYDWNSMSAQQFHKNNTDTGHARHDSNLSSATLTPNTEHDVGVQEMVEVNDGMDALTGVSSRASSSTIEGDAMIVDADGERHGKAMLADQSMEMQDVQTPEEPRVQHIEIAEKKGG
jgi:hypothetical protein